MKRYGTFPARGHNQRWLLAHVKYRGGDCLIGPFSIVRGYPQVSIGKGTIRKASQVMCELAHGVAPSARHHAAHSCGNAACVNPRHISWKTPSANQLDRRQHGTKNNAWWGRKGKLGIADVVIIKSLKGIKSQDELAAMFNVSRENIGAIHRGKTWKQTA